MVFDYIIVGAGSAGCVLANRLSANTKTSVALVEAGSSDWYPWIHIPVGYFKTMGNALMDWCYETQNDAGLNGRSLKWPRGRVMGGSSSINGLLYVRGQAADYDAWAQMGNEGWSWQDVLPLFKRFERWHGNASDNRGSDGELHIEESSFRREITDAWQQAAVNAGFPLNQDYNDGDQYGVAPFQMTIHKGLRVSSAKAFIKPVRSRKNLHLIKKAEVDYLLFDGKRCEGITAKIKGSNTTFKAAKEVILCAGAIGSPLILMRSGIGPQPELKEANIEVRHALKGVGHNLQDHLQARPVYQCTTSTINLETNNWCKQLSIGMKYALKREGPMTMAASLGTAFLSTPLSPDRADIQYHIQPWSADSPDKGPHPFSAFTASVLQLRPQSRGYLALDPQNPAGAPLIHPQYLSKEIDQRTIVEGLRLTRRIARISPLKEVVLSEYGSLADIADEDYDGLLDWARSNSTTIYHPTGTCKMGQDANSVVDATLKVRGIAGLRVADCSIMPQIVSANTNGPAIMIGEKAAQLIGSDS